MRLDLSFVSSPEVMLGVLASLSIILLWLLILTVRLSRQQKKWKAFFATAEGVDLEKRLEELLRLLKEMRDRQDDQQSSLRRLAQKVAAQKGNIAVKRYNAFSNTGSDLSFSVAFLDEQHNGVVITSIYGREDSRTYAKPVENGTSSYHLTEEEKQVIQMASKSVF